VLLHHEKNKVAFYMAENIASLLRIMAADAALENTAILRIIPNAV